MAHREDCENMVALNYKNASDRELLELLEHDEKAFDELYHRYQRLVYYIAYGMCKNDADAKDVVQETFIKVKRCAKDIRDKDRFKAWLNTVAISSCKDLFKRNKYGNIDSDNMYAQSHIKEERRYMLPEQQMHFKSDKELLLYYISKLPENQSSILMMQYFGNMSLHEIADALDLSEGTVKSRIHYAKDTLRGYIEQHNRNEKNKPLDFQALDAILPGMFTYASLKSSKKISFKRKLVQANPLSFGSIGIACSVAGVITVGGYAMVQHFQKDTQEPARTLMNQQNKSDYVNSKDLYFTLMDWAANKEDMENKTAQERDEIQPLYEQLKERNDEYYALLKKVEWTNYYEEILNT